jgi:hypothetical protein
MNGGVMSQTAMERIKRWAKGLLVLVLAWLGSNEFPPGQYDAKPAETEEKEDGEPGFGPALVCSPTGSPTSTARSRSTTSRKGGRK